MVSPFWPLAELTLKLAPLYCCCFVVVLRAWRSAAKEVGAELIDKQANLAADIGCACRARNRAANDPSHIASQTAPRHDPVDVLL